MQKQRLRSMEGMPPNLYLLRVASTQTDPRRKLQLGLWSTCAFTSALEAEAELTLCETKLP